MEATRTDTKKNEMKYEKSELELMTTYQLREICRREKIMNGVIHPLDKEELIQTIMRYMGKRQDFPSSIMTAIPFLIRKNCQEQMPF